jgi:septum formation protein
MSLNPVSLDTSTFILASASPRRRDLLAAAGVSFTVMESGVDESLVDHEDASTYAERTARAKALSVSMSNPLRLVLGADTVVALEGEIMVKPVDHEDARRMLRALSGATHTVVTAFAIVRGGQLLESTPVTAQVTFHHLSDSTIEAYLATDEPFDKAGSYGIQGAGARFIKSVDGGRDTVMGLPVAEVLSALRRHGFDAS